jgi:hypothetical protein
MSHRTQQCTVRITESIVTQVLRQVEMLVVSRLWPKFWTQKQRHAKTPFSFRQPKTEGLCENRM